jgi:hypothetical protein
MTTDDGAGTLQRNLSMIALLIAPPAFIAGILAYFGRVRVQAQSSALGFDASVLGLPTDFYIQTSIAPMFWPLVWLLIVLLVASWAHALISRPSRDWPSAKLRGRGGMLVLIGTGILALAVRASVWTSEDKTLPERLKIVDNVSLRPLAFILAVAAIGYGLSLLAIHATFSNPWAWHVSRLVFALLIAGGLFWAAANYAVVYGGRRADSVAAGGFREYPSVILYSEMDLSLDDAGATTAKIDETGMRYRYRTTGLHLVTTHGQVYVLIAPAGWTKQDPIVIVLTSTEGMRIQFARQPLQRSPNARTSQDLNNAIRLCVSRPHGPDGLALRGPLIASCEPFARL